MPAGGSAQRRGSKPGMPRGPYQPRALKLPEPTAEELERRCREFWGDEYCDAGLLVVHHRTLKPVSVCRYLPPESPFSPDHPSRNPVPPAGWKKCRGCGEELELSDFGPNGRGGFKARCKGCLANDARAYVDTEQGKAARARARAKWRARFEAQEREAADRAAWLNSLEKTPRGRALLAACGRGSAPTQPSVKNS